MGGGRGQEVTVQWAGRGAEREAAFAPRVALRGGVLPEVTEDVTGPAGGGQRRMFSLLGATTLMLVAGAPWTLPAAAGERRGVRGGGWASGWAVGALEASALGGRWKGLMSGRPLLVRGHSAQIENQEEIVFEDPSTPLAWEPAPPSPGRGRPPRHPSPGSHPRGAGCSEPSCRLCVSLKNPAA